LCLVSILTDSMPRYSLSALSTFPDTQLWSGVISWDLLMSYRWQTRWVEQTIAV
jgi:hypothetical protein